MSRTNFAESDVNTLFLDDGKEEETSTTQVSPKQKWPIKTMILLQLSLVFLYTIIGVMVVRAYIGGDKISPRSRYPRATSSSLSRCLLGRTTFAGHHSRIHLDFV